MRLAISDVYKYFDDSSVFVTAMNMYHAGLLQALSKCEFSTTFIQLVT
jgi:hypothetical protein